MPGSVYSDKFILQVTTEGVDKAIADLQRFRRAQATLQEQATGQLIRTQNLYANEAPQMTRTGYQTRYYETSTRDLVREEWVNARNKMVRWAEKNQEGQLVADIQQYRNRRDQIVNEIRRIPFRGPEGDITGWRVEQTFDPDKMLGRKSRWKEVSTSVKEELGGVRKEMTEFVRTRERFTATGESVYDIVGRKTRTRLVSPAGTPVGEIETVSEIVGKTRTGQPRWKTSETVTPSAAELLGWREVNTRISEGKTVLREYQKLAREFDPRTGRAIDRVLGTKQVEYSARTGRELGSIVTEYQRGADGVTRATTKMTGSFAEAEKGIASYGRRLRHHIAIIMEAIIAYEGFRMVMAIGQAWVSAHTQMDWAMAQFRVNVNATEEAVAKYIATAAKLSFATGTPLPEVLETSALATRLRAPELAAPATQIEMLFGYQSTQAIRDLYALRQQFPQKNIEDILDVIIRSTRAGSLTGKEVFDISETWGAFSRQFVLDLDEIAGLFTALGTVLGETGGSLETFMRHLEQFYTNYQLAQLTMQYTGKPTITYTGAGEEVRRPMLDILRDVARLNQAQISEIAEFMPQDLGQKSRQYFNAMISQWGVMESVLTQATTDVYSFDEAIREITDTTAVGAKRLSAAWQTMLASIGDTEVVRGFFSSLASGMNAVAVRNMLRNQGWGDLRTRQQRIETYDDRALAVLQNVLQQRGYSGPNLLLQQSRIAMHTISGTVLAPPEILQARPEQQAEWLEKIARQIFEAPGFDPEATGTELGQAAAQAMLDYGDRFAQQVLFGGVVRGLPEEGERWRILMQAANAPRLQIAPSPSDLARGRTSGAGYMYKYGETPTVVLPAGVGVDQMQSAVSDVAQKIRESIGEYNKAGAAAAGLGISLQESAQVSKIAVDELGNVLGVITGPAYAFESAVKLMANAAEQAANTLLSMGMVRLPEGVSLDAFLAQYDVVTRQLQGVAQLTGKEVGAAPKEQLIVTEGGQPLNVRVLDPDIAALTLQQINANQAAQRSLQQINANQAAQRSLQQSGQSREDIRHREAMGLLREIINAIPGVRSPTPVTGADLYWRTPTGQYQNKFDEQVRRARADVNNILGNRPLEYGLGSLIAPDIFTPELMAYARGLPGDQMAAVLQDALAEYERQFYGGMRPGGEYDRETFLAGARRVIAERQQAKANQAMYEQWMIEAGLGPYSAEILSLMEEAPLVTALTGGKTPAEVQQQLQKYVDVDKIISPAAVTGTLTQGIETALQGVEWAVIISVAITESAKRRRDDLIAAGQVLGQHLADGASSTFVAQVVAMIYAKLVKDLSR